MTKVVMVMTRLCLILFLTLYPSGCDDIEKEFDYIVVTCTANVTTKVNSVTILPDEPVRVVIQKDGGQKVDETVNTDSQGMTSVTAVFNLYRGQPIVATACFVNHDPCKALTLEWETVEKEAEIPTDNGPKKYKWNTWITLLAE